MKHLIKFTWCLVVVATLTVATGSAQEMPADQAEQALVPPPTEGYFELPATPTDAELQDNSDSWMESALLRYRNLEEQTKELESQWLEQFNARMARLKARVPARSTKQKPSEESPVSTKSRQLKLASSQADSAKSASNDTAKPHLPITAKQLGQMPNAVTQAALNQLCDRLLQLEDRVAELEREAGNNGFPLGLSTSSSVKSDPRQEMRR